MGSTITALTILLALLLPARGESQTTIGVEGGVHLSSLAVTLDSDLVTLTTESITRFGTGVRLGVPLTESIGIRLDAGYVQRGGIWRQTTVDSHSETEVTTGSVGAVALATLALRPLPGAYALVGPGSETEISCNLYSEWSGEGLGGPGRYQDDCSDEESWRDSDLFLIGGIGYRRPLGDGGVMPFLEIRYAHGFQDKDVTIESFTVLNRGVSLSAGVDLAFGG